MGIELDKIPGLAEKVAAAGRREEALRILPFLGVDLEICGIDVKQFTPRHFLYLDTAGSPFLCGGDVEAEHVAMFLWVVCPQFAPGDRVARDHFISQVTEVEMDAAVEAIGEYLENAFMDRPATTGASAAAPTSYLAALVDRLAAAYGWTKDVVLDTPFAELFQYLRQIKLSENPKATFINRFSDKVKRESVVEYLNAEKGGTAADAAGEQRPTSNVQRSTSKDMAASDGAASELPEGGCS